MAVKTFAYLITRHDQQRALAAVAAHLRPGGLLVTDLLNPTPDWLSRPAGSVRQDVFGHLPSGASVARTETMVSTDLATQVRVIRSAYETVSDGVVTKHFVEWPFRYTHRFEAEHLLERAGLREHRLAVGLPDTGIAVSERVGERPVERLDAIVERHPRIDLAAVREQFRPAADSREVRGDNNLIRSRLGQRDGGDSDLTRACELDSGGGRRHHLLIMAAGEQAKRHVARVLHAH